MKQELLAPAGNPDAGYAALYYGADAVYLGLKKFSARAGAENFDESELDRLTAYAHHLGRKVYVAINTVIQQEELSDLLRTLDVCLNCRIDAVILQDLGVARLIRESYPELEMHASTQMAVHNKEGALFLKSLGFSRVVVARELTLSEIKEIAAIDGLETEAFIHGALCYSYSGLCQFSALENGRSANRGKCTYPCRSCFKTSLGEKHIFSMKDMALQSDVLKMPVTSLKIEGRKKSALYVAAVTDYYRHILDGKGDDPHRAENIRQIFSRPWCRFHFNGKDKNVIDQDFVGHRGLPIGHIEQVFSNAFRMKITHDLGRYDGLQIDAQGREKPFGFSVQHLKVKGVSRVTASAGETVDVSLPEGALRLKSGWTVYLASSSVVKGSYDYTKPKPDEYRQTTDVDVNVRIFQDRIEAQSGAFRAVLNGNFEQAEQPQKVEESFRSAFAKTGGTVLKLNRCEVQNPENLFVPLSQMNELRRALYAQILPERRQGIMPFVPKNDSSVSGRWSIKTDLPNCLGALNLKDFDEVCVLIDPQSKPKDLENLPKNKIRLALPAVCRHPKIYDHAVSAFLEAGYKKWEVANYWALEVLPIERLDVSFDSPLYMLNTQAMMFAKEIGVGRVAFATEDTKSNIESLIEAAPIDTMLVVYRNAPLFTSAACIRENDCSRCPKGEKHFFLEKDGRQYEAVSKSCQVMLFDKEPVCIAAETRDLNVAWRRIDLCFRSYTPEQVSDIVRTLRRFQNVRGTFGANINNTHI